MNNNGLDNNEYNPQVDYISESKNQGNQGFSKGVAVGVIFSLFAFLCITLLGYFAKDKNENNYGLVESTNGSDILTEEQLNKLEIIQSYINQYAYYGQDSNEIFDKICLGLMNSLDDDYATYYDEEEFKSFQESNAGSYTGIGCVVSQNISTGEVIVVQPYKDSPAYDAGLSVGDIIQKVNDIDVTGMDLTEVVSYIKGEEGTTVNVTYLHDGKEVSVDIERRKIDIKSIEYEMLEGNIGYISISGFEENTVEQFRDAIDTLTSQGVEGLIFDVRSNPGGSYTTVVEMLDMLLPEGTIVYTEDKYGNQITETSDENSIDLPMAVITDGNSASASEIFAGALQDYDKAEIIGLQTYGKGIVQSIVPLGDGTAIKLTIASYFLPNGTCIQGVGITPDQVVELPQEDGAYDQNGYLLREYDTQLDAAVEYIKEITK